MEGRCEQVHPYHEDDHHGILDLVHAHRACDREQQRPEPHECRDALQEAAQQEECDNGDRQKVPGAPGTSALGVLDVVREARLGQCPRDAGRGIGYEQNGP